MIRVTVLSYLPEHIEYASQHIVSALLNDKKILICGNGRSATTAQLFSLAMLNQFERDRPSLPAINLAADIATITAIANDYQFDDIFSKQLRALGQSGDILLIYNDGNNPANIAKVIASAHEKEITVIAITGNENGLISPLLQETDIEIRVSLNSSIRIQDQNPESSDFPPSNLRTRKAEE